MKIAIDARLIYQTGVGRYIQNLIRELARTDTANTYVIFLRKKDFPDFTIPDGRWTKRIADVPWHSLREQIIMPWLFMQERPDIVHIPYFNAPVFYPGKFILTIHDLTILHFNTGKASTLPSILYKIKRLGYRIVLDAGIRRAAHIITVSQTIKNEIVSGFHKKNRDVTVTYEGIDPVFFRKKNHAVPDHPVTGKYFLYVGNVYPHKNIGVLLDAYNRYRKSVSAPARLVFVGPDDYFYKQYKLLVTSLGLTGYVSFFHQISDGVLRDLYAGALALIFPSRMEGFGLPAIEALACGCRVICSDIPVFREIFAQYARFTDTRSSEGLFRLLLKTGNEKSTDRKFKPPPSFFLKYSWKKLATGTLAVYKTYGQSA